MKITFDNAEQNRSVDKGYGGNTSTYRATEVSHHTTTSGVQVDIADRVMDNGAYRSQGKTMEDVMQDAQSEDAAVQKNFMTVMSHSVSGEDLKEMAKEGYRAGDMDVDSYVTIVDKIKVTLAESGVTIDGYNDDLDQDKVAEITGSVVTANELTDAFDQHGVQKTEEHYDKAAAAYDKAASLSTLKDNAMAYLVQNEKEPTIENLYMAQYSTTDSNRQARGYFADGSGYYARKAENCNWEQLEGQIAKVCEKAGYAPDDKQAIENGKWLIQKGIPLTEENLEYLTKLKELDLPKDGKAVAEAIATAIENGKEPEEALLTGEISYTQQGKEVMEQVAGITPEAVELTVSQGKKINIKNLCASQRQITEEAAGQKYAKQITKETDQKQENAREHISEQSSQQRETISSSTGESAEMIKAKRQLAEVQLTMTVEANRKLLSSGYQIDTTDLEILIRDLKKLEAAENAVLFKGTDEADNTAKAALFEETKEKTAQMASMPAAVIGRAIQSGARFTIHYVVDEGSSLKKAYETAGQSYETLMTVPRKDLGDTIQKAFANVDEILKDLNQDITDTNRRAVRILGYNQMEMTQENLEAVKAADLEVNSVMRKLTPAATLSMIRENVNPLTMSISGLDAYLSGKEQSHAEEAVKYSEYLYKLEQNHEITQEERESYIGIYRLCRQIEKGDGAAIGNVVNTGAELSMSNLLSSIRSNKAKGIDVTINDEFGTLDTVEISGRRISDQIEAGFAGETGQNHSESEQQKMENEQIEKSMTADQSESHSERITTERKLASAIKDILVQHPEAVERLGTSAMMDMTLEQLKDALEQVDTYSMREEGTSAYSDQYYQELLREIQSLQSCEQTQVQELMDYGQAVTLDNLLAATVLSTQRGSTFSKVAGIADKALKEEDSHFETEEAAVDADILQSLDRSDDRKRTAQNYGQAVAHLAEGFTDKASAEKAYQEMIHQAENVLEESIDSNQVSSLDVKAVTLLYKQLSLASGFAKEENYEIPVRINGEDTSMNLRILKGTAEKGKVTVTMDTKQLGKVAAEFEVVSRRITENKDTSDQTVDIADMENGNGNQNTMLRCEGLIACDSQKGLAQLQGMKEKITDLLQETLDSEADWKSDMRTDVRINIVSTNILDISKFGQKESSKPVPTGTQNEIAKETDQEQQNRKRMEAAQDEISTRDLYKVAKAFLKAI